MVFGHVPAAVTVLEGIRARLQDARVTHAPGPEIRREVPSFFEDLIPGPKKSRTRRRRRPRPRSRRRWRRPGGADLVIAVMGELANMSGEAASRSSLDLPGRQEELLRSIVGLGKPVVLVLIGGRPLSIAWAAENVPAILEAVAAGNGGRARGGRRALRRREPGGELPVTLPRSAGHAPLYYARNLTHQPEGSERYHSRYWEGPTTPLYPFGYGLSYTTFAYSNLKLGAPELKVGAGAMVSVDVTNTGSIVGDEVVQLYVHQKSGSDSRPVRELKGFRRVELKPGETQTVTFPLGPDELRYWSTSQKRWLQDAAAFDVWVGGDSMATLHADFSVVP